jgi:hypothetical protein
VIAPMSIGTEIDIEAIFTAARRTLAGGGRPYQGMDPGTGLR